MQKLFSVISVCGSVLLIWALCLLLFSFSYRGKIINFYIVDSTLDYSQPTAGFSFFVSILKQVFVFFFIQFGLLNINCLKLAFLLTGTNLGSVIDKLFWIIWKKSKLFFCITFVWCIAICVKEMKTVSTMIPESLEDRLRCKVHVGIYGTENKTLDLQSVLPAGCAGARETQNLWEWPTNE